jgi:hypothetical protein
MHRGALLNYPKTKVLFLFGAHDCGEPVPIGLTYVTKVTSEKRFSSCPHALFSTPEGRDAIRKAIDMGASR